MLEINTKYNPKEKIWEGPKIVHLFNPKVSIGQVILKMLSLHGSKIAQISHEFGVKSTFNEILTKTICAAQNLQKFNFEPKSVFGIMANNGPDVAPIVFASFCLGCPISPIDPSLPKFELKSVINMTKPKIFFCDVNVYHLLEACLTELDIKARIFTFNGQRRKSLPIEVLFTETKNEANFLPVEIDGENETAIIARTHSIAGTLEGICLSHALLLDKTTRLNSIASGDVLFAFSSLYLLSGIASLLKATYFGATRIITTKPYAADLLLELIEKYQITHLFASMHQITLVFSQQCIEQLDLSSVKSITLSGQKVSFDQYSNIKKYFKHAHVNKMFGVSELGGAISVSCDDQLKQHTSGKLMNGIQVKIVDENGNRLEIDQRGRICVKSSYQFLGYYEKSDAESIVDQEGFVKTGCVGYFDQNGFLYVLGREIDMIKYQNHHISPEEIEDVLTQNSSIELACVTSVPDVNHHNLLVALIVRKKGANISEKEVSSLISENHSDEYNLRGGVYFVDTLPSTISGKVIRRLARAIAEREFDCRIKI